MSTPISTPTGTPISTPTGTPTGTPISTPTGTPTGTPGGRLLDRILDLTLDRALATAVTRAGAPGRIRFTELQLYYETCRVLRPLHQLPRRIALAPAAPVRYERFARALRRYGDRHGEVPGLLVAPASAPPPTPTDSVPGHFPDPDSDSDSEPDLYDYGLPRLLVCQSRSVARMLLANDVHLEAACPVFAAADLPLDPRLTAGLGRVDGATVHVLHDASVPGIALTARVRAAFPGVRVVSMGLAPRHARALHLFTRRDGAGEAGPGPVRTALPAGLAPRELDWLAEGRTAEVESVSPARLLRTVLRLARGPRTPVHSVWTGLRDLRTAGFMTWPGQPAGRDKDK
ncbi:hypothetical protein [Streptomyces sp. NPDC088554]|uniref:hypothetical protein n=1 Tax=Streptomyces sp. NPDC088554 TaxID=3365865 RepID=UPI00382B7C24